MLHLLKKLKLHTKLCPGRVHKYSDQNSLVIICRLPSPTKVFLQLEHNTEHNTASSIKSISGVTLSGNAPGQDIFKKFRAAFDIGQKGFFLKKGN